jgi:hypothetical protein
MAIPNKTILVPLAYIKKVTQINSPVDDNIISAAAYIAQDKWVKPYLGDALYDKIVEDSNDNSITGDPLTLRDHYMVDAIAWWTYVEVLPHLTYKIDNATIAQRVSDDTQPIDNTTLNRLIDNGRHNAEYYTKRLSEYLCEKSSLYPELNTNTGFQRAAIAETKSAPVVMISSGNSASGTRGAVPRNWINKMHKYL